MKNDARNPNKPRLALLAGLMFLLAGVIELSTTIFSHGEVRSAGFITGGAFLAAGALWVVVAAKWKKKFAALQ